MRRLPDDLVLGDVVLYYTEEMNKSAQPWKGPATVVAVERDVFLVRQGSAYYRRHPHHLRRWTLGERGEVGDPSRGGPEEKREREIVCTGPRPAEFRPAEDTTPDKK